jgi:hypothetical protein
MPAKFLASIEQYEIADTDELYRLELWTYTSEDGAQPEFSGDYFGPEGLETARIVGQAWKQGGPSAQLIRACAPLGCFQGHSEPRLIREINVETGEVQS